MKPFLIGMTVYGEHYAHLFNTICWPSLMAKGNLPYLKDHRDVGLVIHTDAKTAPLLKDLPFPLLDVTDEEKYFQLGRHQNYDLRAAHKCGADYHCMMPDYYYVDDCFANILKAAARGHKAVARLVVSTNEETITPWLVPGLSLREMATLSLLHMHPGVQHWKAQKENYPNNHVIVWNSKDHLHLNSPHLTPVYIAHEVMTPGDYFKPIDNILDLVISGDIHCTQPEDGIGILEIAAPDGRKPNDERIDLKEFVRIFKANTYNSEKQFKIFTQGTVDPINRAVLSDDYWNEVDILEQQRIINQAIMEG